MKIEFRAKKILSPLFRFEYFDEQKAELRRRQLGLQDEEVPCGIYTNEEESEPKSIVVTTKGLHLLGISAPRFIPYISIVGIGTPTKDPADTTLHVELVDGSRVALAITGREGRLKDIFEFLRFLRRVTDAGTLMEPQ